MGQLEVVECFVEGTSEGPDSGMQLRVISQCVRGLLASLSVRCTCPII